MLSFPQDFFWGVSTSAHQFEGSSLGNQWTAWERKGRIRSGDRNRNACEWWYEAQRDLDLCRELGLNAIRVSVDWGRIEPVEGRWSREAVVRYRNLLEEIRRAGMTPFVTLHHFTHPSWFEEEDGFLAELSPVRFALFAERIVTEFGDDCSNWLTFNEPNVYSAFGYLFGEFPPGRVNRVRECVSAMANIHRAHALAYERIHRIQPDALVGLATNWVEFQPSTNSSIDRLLAFLYDATFNRTSLQLLRSGALPFPVKQLSPDIPEIIDKIDFIGLNVYNRLHVKAPWDEASRKTGGLFVPSEVPQGDRGVELPYGEAYPDGIVNSVKEYASLRVPIYIMENGVPDRADRIRPWVIVQSLQRLHSMLQQGFDVRGYFHWSIVDNFEWNEGWTLRFGLYELNPRTQERTKRRSADIYRKIIQMNGLEEELLREYAQPPSAEDPQLQC